jgi:transposase
MFVRPVLRLDTAAFTFFGGVPRQLVIDNLGTGVDRADLYDPKLNRAYAELAEHYGTLIDPARAGKPKDKDEVA